MNELECSFTKQCQAIGHDLGSRVRAILDEGTALNTKRAYRSDLRYFMTWARITLGYDNGLPVPCPVVIRFIVDHLKGMDIEAENALVNQGVKKAGVHNLNTICRRIASLSAAHESHRLDNPCRTKEVTALLSKARRATAKMGTGPSKKKALTKDLLEALVSTCDDSPIGIRDRALLLFAFASGGRRRSEVAHARVEDLTQIERGYVYRLPHSKTDQEGNGTSLPILSKAAMALDAWLKASGITAGRLFRGITKGGMITNSLNDKTVARIVKKRAALAGFDPSVFGAHSLRSGFITESGRQGVSLGDTMALSGHRTVRVALEYYQAGSVVNNPAALLLG